MKRRAFVQSTIGAIAAAYIPTSFARVPAELRAISRTGKEVVLLRAEIQEFASSLRLALLLPTSPRYDETRKIWNGAWDHKRPALIAQCLDVSDVISAVNFARSHDLLVAVRGGGHSISGKSVCDGGIVIDTSPMKTVLVDPAARKATVEPGVLLGSLDREAQAYGLVCPSGVVSHTGAAGLTLGGGIGILMRKFGLTIDNLLSVDIVTADGVLRHASAEQNPDLYWGVRGGGGNFGVVTKFEYQLHPFGPNIVTGAMLYHPDQAKDMFNRFFEISENADNQLHMFSGMLTKESGEAVVMMGYSFSGQVDQAESVIKPYRNMGKPIAEYVGPINFVKQQSRADAHNNHGRSYYIKGRHVNDYDPDMTDEILERWIHDPRRTNTMRIVRFGGAVAQVDNDATAWPHRNAMWDLEVGASWEDADHSKEFVNWGREYWKALDPYTAENFYVNELMDESQDKVAISYQGNYPRLVELKNKYDPLNLFQLNANIKPSV